MTNTQHDAMLKFARKVEAEYRKAGNAKNAEAAARHIESLENMSVCDSCGEWIVTADICPLCGKAADL